MGDGLIFSKGKSMMESNEIHQEVENFRNFVAVYVSRKEEEFLTSLSAYAKHNGRITTGQRGWYDSLKEKYSPEKIADKVRWDQHFGDEHRETALRIARYYEANPPYFNDIVTRILRDEAGFKLGLLEWKRFCENKYAQKILAEYETDEKFQKGQCIQVRATNKVDVANASLDSLPRRSARNKVANKVGFVLSVNSKPITRAAKGSRIYQVLLAGESSPIFAHESDLKKPRGMKK